MNIQSLQFNKTELPDKIKNISAKLKSEKFVEANKQYAKELELLKKIYVAANKGLTILNINEVINRAGLTHEFLPRLAIAKSNHTKCRFSWSLGSNSIRYWSFTDRDEYRYAPSCEVIVNITVENTIEYTRRYCGVPKPPVDLIDDKTKLKDYYTLFEVDRWWKESNLTDVSKDPYLLKHLGGPFYSVVAHWDLTDVEQQLQSYFSTI